MTDEERLEEEDRKYVNSMNNTPLRARSRTLVPIDYSLTKKERRRKYIRDRARLKRREDLYGVDSNTFRLLLEQQNGKCAICNVYFGDRLQVDHCHVTKKIRGLLCRGCNSGIGFFNDDPGRLTKAASYLMKQFL